MLPNLSGKQLLMLIVAIIVILYVGTYLMEKKTSIMGGSESGMMDSMQMQLRHPMKSMQNAPAQQQPQLSSRSPYTLYNFYSPNCGYSRSFMPAWEEAQVNLAQVNGLEVKAVDCTENEQNKKLSYYYGVKGYPTVVLDTPKGFVEYEGDRSVEDLHRFVSKHLQQQ